MFQKKILLVVFIVILKFIALIAIRPAKYNSTHEDAANVIKNITKKLFTTISIAEKYKVNTFRVVYNFIDFEAVKYDNVFKEISGLTRFDSKYSNGIAGDLIAAVGVLVSDNITHLTQSENYNVMKILDERFINLLEHFLNYYLDSQNLLGNYFYSNTSTDTSTEDDDNLMTSGRRLFGGQPVRIKHYPFMAAIRIMNYFRCAGELVHSDLIVTAASCLQLIWNNRYFRENPNLIVARVGSSFVNLGGEVIPVTGIYFHPEYNPRNLNHNLCVLRLIRHLKFTANHRVPKKIEFDKNANQQPQNVEEIVVVGWGARTASHKLLWENKLTHSFMPVYDWEECRQIYGERYVTRKHFCAGYFTQSSGACNRDVGGPGIVNGVLVGVISFGSSVCGAKNMPTVFTKLGFYADWIESIIEEVVPVQKRRTTTISPHQLYLEFSLISTSPTATFEPETTFQLDPLRMAVTPKLDTVLVNREEGHFSDYDDTEPSLTSNEEMYHSYYSNKFPDKDFRAEAATKTTLVYQDSNLVTSKNTDFEYDDDLGKSQTENLDIVAIDKLTKDISRENADAQNIEDYMSKSQLYDALDALIFEEISNISKY